MAKKKQNFELDDDFGFSADLDIPDFDFDPAEIKDDRSAVTKVVSGVKDGVKDTVMSPSFIRKMIKKSLPQGYGSAMDMADETADTFKNLYNDAAKEIKPVVKDMKRVTKRLMPAAEAVLPRKMAEKIKKWTETDPDKPGSFGMSADQMREASLQAQMGEIFQYQSQQQVQDKAENEAKQTIRDSIEHDRHRDMLGQLDAMRVSLQQLAGYQDKVDTAYKRKSLELQFRHYFVAVDSLEEQKKFNTQARENLEAIMKNTGLPDFVKLRGTERLHEVLRNKFIDGVNDNIFSKRRAMIGNIGKKMGVAFKDKFSGFLDNVKDGIGAADGIADLHDMQQDFGGAAPGSVELGGNIVGSMAADTMGGRLGKWIRKNTNKIDPEGRVDKIGNKLQYGVENAPQLLVDYARSDKHETGGMFDGLVRTLKDAILSSNSVDNTIQSDNLRGMQDPMTYNRAANKSIVEIIPGYLARIYRELQITRTGNENIELVSYDFMTNKFSEKSKAVKSVLGSIVKESDKSTTKDQFDKLIKEIDPENTLDENKRKELGKFLLRENLRNGSGTASRLKDYDTYTGKLGRYADKFSTLFTNYFEDDKHGEKQLKMSRMYNQLGSSISDSRAVIQDHVNAGNRQALEELGLLKPGSDAIDMNRLYDYVYGDEEQPAPTPAPGQPAAPQQRRRVINQRRASQRPQPQPRPVRQPSPTLGPAPQPAQVASPASLPASQPINLDVPAQPTHSVNLEITKLVDAMKGSSSDIVKAVKDESAKSISQTISDILARIEEKLNKGITINLGGGEAGTAGMAGGPSSRRWHQRSLSELGSGLWGLGGRMLGKGKDKLQQGKDKLTDWGGVAKDYLKDQWTNIREQTDVFVKGEIEPRLLKAKLEAGVYRDAISGDVIRRYKDIKGAVIDSETGEFVLKKEDLKNMFVKSKLGKKIVNATSWLGGKLLGVGQGAYGAMPGIKDTAISWGKKGIGFVKDLLDQPQDVYVEGREDPVLYASVMREGWYRSKKTGKVITRPSEIDGPILDENGDIVLTNEQFGKGIFDKHGKPIRTGVAKITGAIKDAFAFGTGLVTSLFGKGMEKLSGLKGKFGGIGKWFGDLFSKGGIFFGGGKTVVDRLTEIRNLLNDRLPAKKKHVVGDVDGDGIREGSYQDMLKHKSKSEKSKAEAQAAAAGQPAGPAGKGKSLFGTVGSGIKGLYDRLRGKKKKGEDEDEDGNPITDIAEDVARDKIEDGLEGRGRRRATRAAKGKGRFGKLAGKIGLKGVGKMLGLAGAAYGGYSAYENLKEGNYGEAAMDAGLTAVSLGASTAGIGATASAIGAGAATIGGALLSGAGALISSPVLLPALAIAAIGAGAYMGYKYLSKKKLDAFSKLRYAQYGFLPTDEDHLQQVLGLEDDLKKGVVFNSGVANLDEKKIDFKDVVKKFGIDLKDKNAVQNWLRWFLARFKPVYLVHMSAMNKIAPQKGLDDVSSLKPEEQKQYLEIAKYPTGPYDERTSPFPDMQSLKAGSDEVKNMADLADAEVKKGLGSKVEDKGTGLDAAKAAAPSVAAATAAGGVSKPQAATVSNEMLSQVKSDAGADTGMTDSRGVITAMGVPIAANQFATGKVGGLPAVRYKTYGLKELVLDKVRALDSLETYVLKEVKWGKGNVAKWEGSVEKALQTMGPVFGVQVGTNDDSSNWMTWFSQRFLPTFMNYLTAIAAATDKTDPKIAYVMLKPQQLVDVAMAVYTSNGRYSGSNVSVWQIPASPWPNYELNNDVKSVETNVNGLKEDAKRTVLDEQKGKTALGKDAQGNPAKPEGFFAKATSSVGKALTSAWNTVKDSVTGLFGGPKPPDTNGGREVLQPGSGTGGDINSIPKPTGNKSWAALKDTILAAAKMVGVDEKMMATFAAIESGFDYTIKAATSSASGLYQFVNDTWRSMLKKYGSKYGIDPSTSQTDPRANALMGAEYMKESVETLKGALKRPITDTDVYLAHFLGPGGAKKFLTADPNAVAANILPDAARANVNVFYEKDGRPRSVAEMYAEVNNRVRRKGSQFGADAGSEALVTKASTPAATASGTTAPSSGPTVTPPATTTGKSETSVILGGGGNVTPPPAPKAANALSIPVADTAPGALPALTSGGKDNGSSKAVTKPQAQPVSADVAAMGASFMSNRTRDLQAQSQYQKDLKEELLGTIDTTAKEQLNVQKDMRDSLKSILELARAMAKQRTEDKPQPAPAPVPAQQPVTVRPGMQAMQRAPVSMAKPSY